MFSYTLKQLSREREELEKVYRLAESLENQKRDEEKTKKLQEMIREKGLFSSLIGEGNLFLFSIEFRCDSK